MKPLENRVTVVAGATRGAGRGIACGLGELGAIVYCTGRSVPGAPSDYGRSETIDETAAMVSERGGQGIPVRCDHSSESEVIELFRQVRREQGRLDVLVNDIWGGDPLTEWGKPFWELDLEKGFRMLRQAVSTHIITARHGVPLMLESGKGGLVVEITDGDFLGYHGNLFYDLCKAAAIRLAYSMNCELRDQGLCAVAVSPGFLRSEMMLDHFGVGEGNWREAGSKDPHFLQSETPFFVGRGVAALAADPNVAAKGGQVFGSWTLGREYGLNDVDDRRPDWGAYMDGEISAILQQGGPADDMERFLLRCRYYQVEFDHSRREEFDHIASMIGLPVSLDLPESKD